METVARSLTQGLYEEHYGLMRKDLMILVALNFAMTLITDRFTLNITTTCQQPFPSYDHFKNDSNEFESITNLEKNEDFKHTCQLLNPLSPAYIC